MTKTLFRKLHMLEGSISTSTGVILCALGHEYWGIFFILLGFSSGITYKFMIETYEKEGYLFSKE